jgi:hypothetical protein
MTMTLFRRVAVCVLVAGPTVGRTQSQASVPLPTQPGQAAYAAISEVVRILKADPATDWSRVNIEALRQHLIDMNEVTLNASVNQRNVPGGIAVDVTGEGRAIGSIRRVAASHGMMLDQSPEYQVTSTDIPGGAHLVYTARDSANARTVARIRGLGFAGLLTEGDHHAMHHIALARGNAMMHER